MYAAAKATNRFHAMRTTFKQSEGDISKVMKELKAECIGRSAELNALRKKPETDVTCLKKIMLSAALIISMFFCKRISFV